MNSCSAAVSGNVISNDSAKSASSGQPLERNGGVAVAFVAPENLELLAVKQVGNSWRVHLDQARSATDLQLEVGPHGPLDLGRERGHLQFQVFVRTNIRAGTARRFRQRIEQLGVDIVADPERVDPHAFAIPIAAG